jgi:glutamyl-tRNA reductase
VKQDREAVRHLFRVAAGLDSLVLGESQIQGQVRRALELSRPHSGTVLDRLFQVALRAGGRVRSETTLGTGAASVPSASVDLARKIFGNLNGRRALVLGSGEIAELAMQCLAAEGVTSAMVAHRHLDHAAEVARRLGGRAVTFEDAWPLFGEVDIVVCSTAAPHAVVTRDKVGDVIERRAGRPLCILDIAVPRDVEPKVGGLEAVFLYDIDDLQGVVEASLSTRGQVVPGAEQIVAEEVGAYWEWYRGRRMVDAIRALRDRMERVRASEVEEIMRRMPHLDPTDRERIERLTRALMNKFLHGPTEKLRHAAGNGRETEIAEAARYLFALDAPPEGEAGHSDGDPGTTSDEQGGL